jgi:hypothetical protein
MPAPLKRMRALIFKWFRVVSNHRPLACQASTLPLSYGTLLLSYNYILYETDK